MPDSAKVSLAEMEAWDKDEFTVGALIISYPWLDKNHPDPFGEQLQQLAFILKAFADEARKYPGCRVGVFWDYCSLPQKDLKGNDDRTAELIARFKRALKGINAWYGHPKTQVVLVKTPLPTGYEYTNKQPYAGRGWCYAENLMSCIVKDDFALFDTSQLQGTEIDVDGLREKARPIARHQWPRTSFAHRSSRVSTKATSSSPTVVMLKWSPHRACLPGRNDVCNCPVLYKPWLG